MVTTPQLWDSSRNHPENYFDPVYLTNGNVLYRYEGTDTFGNPQSPESPTEFFQITDGFGNEIGTPTNAFQTAIIGTEILDVIAIPGGGFAALGNNNALIQSATLNFDIYSDDGTLVSSRVLQPNFTPEGVLFDVRGNAELTLGSDGTVLVSYSPTDTTLVASNPYVVGWTIDPDADPDIPVLPFIMDNNGAIGLFNANAEDPLLIETVALDGGQFASLILERDAFGLTSRDTLNILISNADGSEVRTIDLTTPGNGAVLGRQEPSNSDPVFTHIGNGNMVVLFQTDPFAGGDGVWRITAANSDGSIGITLPINTNGVNQSFINTQLIGLTDSTGDLNGEFLLSYYDANNQDIFIQRYSGVTGILIGDPILIPISTSSALNYSIELLDANRFLVNYIDTLGAEQRAIYTYDDVPNLFDAAGSYIGTIDNDNLAMGIDDTSHYYLSFGVDTVIEDNFDNNAFIDFGGDNDTFLSSLSRGSFFTNGLTLDGGSGFDTYDASFAIFGQNINVDFLTGGVLTVDNLIGSQTISNFESFIGGSGDDDLRGSNDDNSLDGGNGDDLLLGRGGIDLLRGGDGDDIIFAGTENDFVFAGDDDDIIIGDSGSDTLSGEGGDDTFYQWNHSGAATDSIVGGTGFDTIRMQVYTLEGPQIFSGTDFTYTFSMQNVGTIFGSNERIGFSEIERLVDGDGDANFTGSNGNDQFLGSGGEDTILGGDGADFLDGGADNDRFIFTDAGDLFGGSFTNGAGGPVITREQIIGRSGTDRIVLDLADGDELELDEADVFSIEEIEFAQTASEGAENGIVINSSQLGGGGISSQLHVIGSNAQGSFIDIISVFVDDGSVAILRDWQFSNWGRDGQEINIVGSNGGQVLIGTNEDDTIAARGGSDNLTGGLGDDTINGGDGEDIVIAQQSDGDDTYTGGSGFDVLDFSAVQGVVQVNQLDGVITGSAGNDTLNDVFEQIIGSNFNDVLSGGNGGDVLEGNDGNDQFFANGGEDLVRGGEGNDMFFFSTNDGDDRLEGGAGFDVLDYSTLQGVVQVNQLDGTTTGTANNDTLLDVFEQVIGTDFGDVLSGGNGINVLNGGAGDDQLFANGEDDQVSGGAGNDTITMGTGDDRLDFRNGDETDTVTDFNAGAGSEDQIILTFHSAATSFAQMQMAGMFSQQGADTHIDLGGGDLIVLNNVNVGDLHQDDFIF